MKQGYMKRCRWYILCIKTHVRNILCVASMAWLQLVPADVDEHKIPKLEDMAMRVIVDYISKHDNTDGKLNFMYMLPPLMREIIVKAYFLQYEDTLDEIPFVVSIKELLSMQRKRTIKPSEVGLLYLNFLHLGSVDGIKMVPKVATVTSCSLSFNSFCRVPYQLGSVMPKLKELRLSKNMLKQVQAADLAPFPELKELSLQRNEISSLPEDVFLHNPKLSTVNLQRNPIDKEQVRRVVKRTNADRKKQNNSCMLAITISYNGRAGEKPLTIAEYST